MRRSWTGPVLLAIAALLIAGPGTPALASQPSTSLQRTLVAGDTPVAPESPEGDVIVVQYGDPDDAITGNRGPASLGQTSGLGEEAGDETRGQPCWPSLLEELLGAWVPFLLP